MGKLLKITLIFLFICAFGLVLSNILVAEASGETIQPPKKQFEAQVQSKRLNKGTTLTLQLLDPISTASSSEGDMFSAMLIDDKIQDGTMILPKGTIFRGDVKQVIPAKRVSRGAALYVDLDHVVTPNGKQLRVNAALLGKDLVLTTDGGIKAGGNYGYALQKNGETMTKIIGKSIDIGAHCLDNVSYVKFITIPVMGIGGTVVGVAYYIGDAFVDLFRKGGNVTFHQGANIEFFLTAPIDVSVN